MRVADLRGIWDSRSSTLRERDITGFPIMFHGTLPVPQTPSALAAWNLRNSLPTVEIQIEIL